MTYTLYGTRGSGSAAIEMALRRCGVDWQDVRASEWEADSAQAALLAVNPLGQIPTLVTPDGAVLTESAAILMHLGLRFPASGLLPGDAAARDQVLRGLVYIPANCYSAVGISDYPQRWTTATDTASHEAVRAAARQRLHQAWSVFADTFPASPWLDGAQTGALDMLTVVVSRWSGSRAHLAADRPAFHALLERIQAEPDIREVCARHWPPAG